MIVGLSIFFARKSPRGEDDRQAWDPVPSYQIYGHHFRDRYARIRPRGLYYSSDRELEDAIRLWLKSRPQTNTDGVKVSVKRGEVQLDGYVNNKAEQRELERLVESVPHVRALTSRLHHGECRTA